MFLVLPAHILLYTTLLKFSCTKNSIQHSIIVGPTTKMDTTNRIIAIVNEATWWCKWVHAKANKQKKTISSNRIESFSSLPNRPALLRTTIHCISWSLYLHWVVGRSAKLKTGRHEIWPNQLSNLLIISISWIYLATRFSAILGKPLKW